MQKQKEHLSQKISDKDAKKQKEHLSQKISDKDAKSKRNTYLKR